MACAAILSGSVPGSPSTRAVVHRRGRRTGCRDGCVGAPRADVSHVLPLLLLTFLSSLTSAFKVQFPIASGSTMSVSYVVDIAALIVLGPHAAMIVGAIGALGPVHVQRRQGQPAVPDAVQHVGRGPDHRGVRPRVPGARRIGRPPTLKTIAVPLLGMTATYFLVNTAADRAGGRAQHESERRGGSGRAISRRARPAMCSAPPRPAVMIAVTSTSGAWLALFLTAAPLYLTYRVYRASVEVEARQGAILEAAHDAILTIDPQLNIREFNPAAERMFGRPRMDILGRNVELLLPPADRAAHLNAFSRYLTKGDGPLGATAASSSPASRPTAPNSPAN